MTVDSRFFLRISCMTYNHAQFVKEALQGFVMQETTFPFVAIIVDDASSDETQEVIKCFLSDCFDVLSDTMVYEQSKDEASEIVARNKTNKNCFFVVYLLKENHYHLRRSKWRYIAKWTKDIKYTAICEGDDFWIDPNKLQKQVDFMEMHNDYSMCFHKVNVFTEIEADQCLFSYLEEKDYSAREVYQQWIVPTCSVLYRRYKGKPFEHNSSVVFTDNYYWLQLAERGKLRCLGFTGATYRRYNGSASCGYSVQTSIKLYEQYKYFEKRFPELKDISRGKQELEGLADIIKAPYFPGIWKYRFLYMLRHRKLFLSSFFTDTIFFYTPIRYLFFWRKS